MSYFKHHPRSFFNLMLPIFLSHKGITLCHRYPYVIVISINLILYLPLDLDECKAREAMCVPPAVCSNTYGNYRCVCNGTHMESCVLGEYK